MLAGDLHHSSRRLLQLASNFGVESTLEWLTVPLRSVEEALGVSLQGGKFKQLLKQVHLNSNAVHQLHLPAKLQLVEHPGQKRLEMLVKRLFNKHEVIINARKRGPNITNPVTGVVLELDVWIPSLQLAFEYQDDYHYTANFKYSWSDDLDIIQARDAAKKQQMDHQGCKLVYIPYWWDGRKDTLIATIVRKYSELRTLVDPTDIYANWPAIPEECPELLQGGLRVPGLGAVMLPSFYSSGCVPTGWWMGEKYDGIRGIWNPHTEILYGKRGTPLRLSQSHKEYMPQHLFLDGEMWFGRGRFITSLSVINSFKEGAAQDNHWSAFRYVVFDSPDPRYIKLPLKTRYGELMNGIQLPLSEDSAPKQLQSATTPADKRAATQLFIVVQPYWICSSNQHAVGWTERIWNGGGEGTVFRDPEARYIPGRTRSVFKLKVRRDAEAKVISINLISLTASCLLPNGLHFSANIDRSMVSDPEVLPKVGDVISFYYTAITKQGAPSKPEIYRVRKDMTWDDVCRDSEISTDFSQSKVRSNNYPVDVKTKKGIKSLQRDGENFKKAPGHWVLNNYINCRKFFDEFSKSKGKDPLDPKTWFGFTGPEIRKAGGSGVLGQFGWSYRRAVKYAYPELFITFQSKDHGHWAIAENRRQFFDELSAKLGIDPLLPAAWANVTTAAIRKAGGRGLLAHFGGSNRKAILDSYPDIPLDSIHFKPKKLQTTI